MQEMYQNYVEGADDWDVPRVSHNPNPRKKSPSSNMAPS